MSIGSGRNEPVLARWGRLVHRTRRGVLILSALSLLASAWVIHAGGRLDPPDVPTETESGRALRLVGRELPAQPPSFSLIFSSPTLSATDPEFRTEVQRALAPLARDPRVAGIRTAYDGLPGAVSRDGRRMLAVVELRGRATGFASLEFSGLPPGLYQALRELVQSPTLEALAAGNIALNHDFTEVARQDLGRVELYILPLVAVLLLLVFGSVVFGLSMDYEVLLLSRMREEYERIGDNVQAVAAGLERTGRLITGAAAIMAAVFFGFGLAHSVIIQAVGVGIGIAVIVDATIVRALLVPAAMRLMGRWNWWRPAWLGRRRAADSRGGC